jgi:hypothetical protein
MAARGLTFPFAAIVDLVEGNFPSGRPDPLLFDSERRALARQCERPLPLKVALRPSEERQLFGIAAGSATQRLVLTASRRDEALSAIGFRPLSSPMRSGRHPTAARARRDRRNGRSGFTGPARLGGGALDRALAASGRPPSRRSTSPLARVSPGRSSCGSRLDGLRRTDRLGRAPGARDPSAELSALPFRLEGGDVRELPLPVFPAERETKEWEEPERLAELDPRALGITFHDAARLLVESSSEWPPSSEEAAGLAGACAEAAVARHEAGSAPIVPGLIREISVRRIELLLRAWLRHEAGRRDRLRPVSAERPLGSREEPFVLDAGGFSIRFTGSIDRVDEDPEGRPARVIDYKVKLAPGFKKAFGEGRIVGGEAVQLPIYSLAVGGDVASEYLVLQAGITDLPAVEAIAFSADETEEAIGHLRTFLGCMVPFQV